MEKCKHCDLRMVSGGVCLSCGRPVESIKPLSSIEASNILNLACLGCLFGSKEDGQMWLDFKEEFGDRIPPTEDIAIWVGSWLLKEHKQWKKRRKALKNKERRKRK